MGDGAFVVDRINRMESKGAEKRGEKGNLSQGRKGGKGAEIGQGKSLAAWRGKRGRGGFSQRRQGAKGSGNRIGKKLGGLA